MSPPRMKRRSPDAKNAGGKHQQPAAEAAEEDHLDRLPDSVLLLILEKVSDMEYLTRCLAVSRRFLTLVPQIRSLLIRFSNRNDIPSPSPSPSSTTSSSIGLIPRLASHMDLCFVDPIRHFRSPQQGPSAPDLLRTFPCLRTLSMEVPHLPQDDLLPWKAHFGHAFPIFVALSSTSASGDGAAPGFLRSSDMAKLGFVCIIYMHMAADFLHPVIEEHPTIERLVLTDAAPSQWKLTMERWQMPPELYLHAFAIQIWRAPRLELPKGVVLEKVRLVLIQPKDGFIGGGSGESFASTAFEEPYGAVARMLMMKECSTHSDFFDFFED